MAQKSVKPVPRPSDPEVLRFIEESEAAYPPEANTAEAPANRRHYDRMCEIFRQPRPEDVTATDTLAGQVPIRLYRKQPQAARGCVLYLHGGGFVVGSLDSHDDICAEICSRTGYDVIAADYRLAPEHVYPAQLDDAETVWRYVTDRYRRAMAAGDSAGGCLAAALCFRMRRLGGPMPAGMGLIYPVLGSGMDLSSYVENAHAPMLTTDDCEFYLSLYAGPGGKQAQSDPECAPLMAKDFTGLPPAFAVSADLDPVRDDSRVFAERLRQAGQEAEWRNEPQLVHGYLRARQGSKRARESFSAICIAISRIMSRRLRRDAGGDQGMRHFLEQFGPALKLPWTKLEAPELTDELIDRMVEGTEEQAEGKSVKELERLRDNCLIAIVQALRSYDVGAGKILHENENRRISGSQVMEPWNPSRDIPAPLNLYRSPVLAEWVDYNKHMTESAYLLAIGWAADALYRFLGNDDAGRDEGFSFFTAETRLNHYQEAAVGDPLMVTTQLLDCDAKRLHVFHAMTNEDTGALFCSAEQIALYVDMNLGRASPMPTKIHQAVKAVAKAHAEMPVPEQVGRQMKIKRK